MLSSSVRADTSSILLFSAVSLSTYLLIKVLKGASNKNGLPLPPSLPSVPMLGSFPFMGSLNKLPDTLREISQRLGAVFSIKVGSQYVVVLNTRAIIYEALSRKSAAFSGRLMGYTTLEYLNPHQYGIVHKQYGPEFRKFHQVTLNILKEFGFGSRMMQERILEETEELLHLIEQQNSEAFNPCNVIGICTLNVISSIVFGKRLSQTHPALEELTQNFREMIQDKRRQVDICPALRYLPSYQSIIAGSIANQEEHMKFITDRLEESLETERDSFVKRFVEFWGKDSCDMNELKFIIRDLLIAGSETTSSTAQFAMLRMANHPDVQKRMQAEMDSVVGRGRTVTLEDLGKMPYVQAVLMEVQRIHTVVPLALPHCTLEDAELGGYFIPKGTIVYPNIKSAHMDPNIWQDPGTFNPDRFLDSEGQVKGKELLIPFSIGKRSCLGELLARQEIFLIITNLVHKFTILPPEGQKDVIIEENFLVTSFLSPYQIRFQSRV